jgi:5-methylcytosine-specific restriction endonuclease McrA
MLSYPKYQVLKETLSEEGKVKAGKKSIQILEREWFEQQIKKCEKCGRTEKLTIDHIIPKDIVHYFGIDLSKEFWPKNFRILCSICNHFKGNQLDFSTSKTKELLLELLSKI